MHDWNAKKFSGGSGTFGGRAEGELRRARSAPFQMLKHFLRAGVIFGEEGLDGFGENFASSDA